MVATWSDSFQATIPISPDVVSSIGEQKGFGRAKKTPTLVGKSVSVPLTYISM